MHMKLRSCRIAFILLLCLFQPKWAHAKVVVINPNRPLRDQLCFSETEYIVKDNIDLKGESIQLPHRASLVVKSGTISNGELTGSDSFISLKRNSLENVAIGDGVTSTSTIVKSSYYKKGCDELIESLCNICPQGGTVVLNKRTEYSIKKPVVITKGITIKGKKRLLRLKNPDNCAIMAFDVQDVSHFNLNGLTIDGSWDPNRDHGKYTDQYLMMIKGVESISITKCVFQNAMVLLPSWREREPAMIMISDYCDVLFDENTINNCYVTEGIAIRNDDKDKGKAIITNNLFNYAFTSSCLNAFYGRYVIKNNCFGTCRGSAINMFGYDSSIVGNTFYGSHFSCAIDLSESGSFNYPSHDISIINNTAYFCYDGFIGGHNVESVLIKGNYYNASTVKQPELLDYYDSRCGQPKWGRQNDKMLVFSGNLKSITVQGCSFIGGNTLLYLEDDAERKYINIIKNDIELNKATPRSAIVFNSVDGLLIRQNVFRGTSCTPGYIEKPVFIATLPIKDIQRSVANVTIEGNSFYADGDMCFVFAQSIYERSKDINFLELKNINIIQNNSNIPASLIFVDKKFSFKTDSSITVKNNDFKGGTIASNIPVDTDIVDIDKVNRIRLMSLSAQPQEYIFNTVVQIDGQYYYVVAGGRTTEKNFSKKNGFLRNGQVILQEITY